jgi:hypothetical protein
LIPLDETIIKLCYSVSSTRDSTRDSSSIGSIGSRSRSQPYSSQPTAMLTFRFFFNTIVQVTLTMAFGPIARAWSALKQHRKNRKAARRARRKQKEADMKVLAAQLKRADDMRRIKPPKSSADYVLRHFYEAGKVRAGTLTHRVLLTMQATCGSPVV